MEKYRIENSGCDDTTYFELILTEDELKTIINFIQENNKNSSYNCQPTIRIYEVKEIEEVITRIEYKELLKEEE